MAPRLRIAGTGVLVLVGIALLLQQRSGAPTHSEFVAASPAAPKQTAVANVSTAAGESSDAATLAARSNTEWSDRSTTRTEPDVVSEWARPHERGLIAALRAEVAASKRGRIPLSIGPGREFELEVQRVQDLGGNEGVVIGKLVGRPDSTVVLSYVEDAAAGTVHLPNSQRALNLYRTEDGLLRVIEIDLSRAPECPVAIVAGTETTPAATAPPPN